MKQLLLIFTLVITTTLNAQTWQWGKRGGGLTSTTVFQENVSRMCVDSEGNVTVGSLIGSFPGPGNIDIDGQIRDGHSVSFITNDVTIASFGCDGTLRWSKIIGIPNDDSVSGIANDALGNVYVTYRTMPGFIDSFGFERYTKFDTDTILPISNEMGNTFKKTMSLVKYDKNGVFQWLRMPQPDIGTFPEQLGRLIDGIAVDPNGNSYLLCRLNEGIYADGAYTVTSTDFTWHILKYDTHGTFISAYMLDIQRMNLDKTKFVVNFDTGHCYIAGNNVSESGITSTFGGIFTDKNKFLVAYDATGAFLWLRQTNGPESWDLDCYDVVVGENNNLYFTGTARFEDGDNWIVDGFNGVPFLNPTGLSIPLPFLIKLNAAGDVLWQTNGLRARAKGITVSNDEVAITGESRSFTWQNLTVNYPNDNGNGQFPFVARFNKYTGEIIGSNYLTSMTNSFDKGYCIKADPFGNYYIGGSFQYVMYVANDVLQTFGGNSDFFVAKLGSTNCTLGDEGKSQFGIKAYPNPVKNQLNFTNTEDMRYEIYNLSGATIGSGILYTGSSIYMSAFPAGMYLVQLRDTLGGVSQFKILKE